MWVLAALEVPLLIVGAGGFLALRGGGSEFADSVNTVTVVTAEIEGEWGIFAREPVEADPCFSGSCPTDDIGGRVQAVLRVGDNDGLMELEEVIATLGTLDFVVACASNRDGRIDQRASVVVVKRESDGQTIYVNSRPALTGDRNGREVALLVGLPVDGGYRDRDCP